MTNREPIIRIVKAIMASKKSWTMLSILDRVEALPAFVNTKEINREIARDYILEYCDYITDEKGNEVKKPIDVPVTYETSSTKHPKPVLTACESHKFSRDSGWKYKSLL
tara:strand:- start:755 stop:1081 length:327 start_codon:yes stop_codon:yes gene_type:complete